MHKLNIIVINDDIVERIQLKKQLDAISPPLNSRTMSNSNDVIRFFASLPKKQLNDRFLIFLESKLPKNDTELTLDHLSILSRRIVNLKVIMIDSLLPSNPVDFTDSYNLAISFLTRPIKQKKLIRSINTIESR